MTDWLTGWGLRKSHLLTHQTGMGTDYQVCIKVYKGTGTDGTEVYTGLTIGKVYVADCNDDFSDIRFTDDDGDTVLSYWRESYTSGVSAIFWIKVNDSLETDDVTIYIYYDKADATYIGDIEAMSLFGDDFDSGSTPDTDRWTVTGSPTISGGILTIPVGANIIGKTNLGPANVAFRSLARPASYTSTSIHWLGFGVADGSNGCGFYDSLDTGYVRGHTIKAGTGTLIYMTDYQSTSYRIFQVYWASSASVKFQINGGTVKENTTNIPIIAIPLRHYSRVTYGPVVNVDWTFARKFVPAESSVHGTWGEEETPAVAVELTFTEIVGVLDASWSRTKTIYRILTEIVGLKDTFTRLKTLHRIYTEICGMKDWFAKGWFMEFTEVVGMSDSYSRKKTIYRLFTEIVGIFDPILKKRILIQPEGPEGPTPYPILIIGRHLVLMSNGTIKWVP